jgi:hypothetical protein
MRMWPVGANGSSQRAWAASRWTGSGRMSEHGLLPGPVVPAVPVEWRKCLFPRIGEGVVVR